MKGMKYLELVKKGAVAVPQNAGKERIRGPNLAVFIKYSKGVPMEEALRRTDEAGLVIASNKRLSKALLGSDEWREWRGMKEAFPCWGGDMTGYDKPDQKLGKTIEYVESGTGIRYVFPVPEEHVGKKNVILVAEHPDFTLEQDGNNRIVVAQTVGIVNCFPTAEYGWFLGDPKYDIPHGDKVDRNNRYARYLWRIESRVGLVARAFDDFYDFRQNVLLGSRPSVGFGVAVEATEGGAPKKTDSPNRTAPEQVALIRGISPEDPKRYVNRPLEDE